MICPKGAEMQLTGSEGDGGEYLTHVLSRHGLSRDDLESAEEYCILPDDNIFVMGTLRENPWATRNARDSSLSRIGPGFVSLDEADLLRREALPGLDKSALGGCSGTRVQLVPTCDFNAGPEPIRDFYLSPA